MYNSLHSQMWLLLPLPLAPLEAELLGRLPHLRLTPEGQYEQ